MTTSIKSPSHLFHLLAPTVQETFNGHHRSVGCPWTSVNNEDIELFLARFEDDLDAIVSDVHAVVQFQLAKRLLPAMVVGEKLLNAVISDVGVAQIEAF